MLPEFRAIKKIANPTSIKSIGKEALKQAGSEAVTEGAQTVVERGAVASVDPTKEVFTPEGVSEIANAALIGKKLERQPNVLYNAGLYYDDGMFDAAFFTNYTGDNFTAANNAIELKGWNVANLDAGVKLPLGGNSVRIGVNVFNLFNTRSQDIEYFYESSLKGEAVPVWDRHVHPAEPRQLRLSWSHRFD